MFPLVLSLLKCLVKDAIIANLLDAFLEAACACCHALLVAELRCRRQHCLRTSG